MDAFNIILILIIFVLMAMNIVAILIIDKLAKINTELKRDNKNFYNQYLRRVNNEKKDRSK